MRHYTGSNPSEVFVGNTETQNGCAGTLDLYGGMGFDGNGAAGNPYGSYGIIYAPDAMPNTEVYIGHKSSIPDIRDNNTGVTDYGFRVRIPLSKR